MDDELKKLEAELHRLRPVAPGGALREKLERTIHATRRRRPYRSAIRAIWVALPIAAAIALAMLFRGRAGNEEAKTAEAAAASFAPVAAENTLLAARDEGYVTFADGTPARRVRKVYLDTITWRNPNTQASLTWSVPREEVRIVPVTLQ